MEKTKKKNRRIVVWGTGEESQKLMDYISKRKYWEDSIVAFCDNAASLDEIFNDIRVVNPSELKDIQFDFLVIATIYIKDIRKQIEQMDWSFDFLILTKFIYQAIIYSEDQYWIRCGKILPANYTFRNEQVCVYTVLTGNSEKLVDPEFTSDDIKYICLTNNRNIHSDVWEVRIIDNLGMDDMFLSRYAKMFPCEFIEFDGLIYYVDAKYKICRDLREYCNRYWRGAGMLCFPHFRHESICQELAALINYRPQWNRQYVLQISDYFREGLDDDFPAFDMGCFVRDMRNSNVKEAMRIWWEQLVKYNVPRDQIPFRYAIWKTGFMPDISDLYIELNEYLEVIRL